ncbi:hypothetical protein NQ314_012776 [Rhamnusium bicolor]|uniref:Angiotensin-converting enzyme n=1 Tax=Rhamnusium bicolor TaxID=1586634 RepID=A0AAV8XAA7_9CUCU|nr:hypothetical protein NQ314_012776 [Rhamnusium bicolor]
MTDKGALWRDRYEDPNFAQNMDYLWMQVEPLYAELHKYLSIKLKLHHGGKIDVSDGLIPDHIFFNHFQDLVKPFSDVQDIEHEVSWALGTRYTVLGLFQKAEIFLSLGLLRMSMCYDERFGAMIYEPSDGRQVVCHADSWDLCDGKTFCVSFEK